MTSNEEAIIHCFQSAGGGFSADRIVVDPDLNERFILACHGAGLSPEILGRVIQSESVLSFRVDGLTHDAIPTDQGLYVFYDPPKNLYVGEASNLRSRLKKHLDHSDNRGLARWLWEHGTATALLELHVLVELMLRYWNHPKANDADFRYDLLETAAEVLRSAVAGQPLIKGLPPDQMNLVSAI